jgi:hypothetical protein
LEITNNNRMLPILLTDFLNKYVNQYRVTYVELGIISFATTAPSATARRHVAGEAIMRL